MREKLDIAIVGAGPAGLASALLLHRAGHRAKIFERFDEPKPLGSGLILQPTGMTVLHHLALLDEMLALGSRLERLYGVDATTGRPVLDVRYGALPGGRFGLGVHRAALFGVLYRAVLKENIEIVTGVDIASTDRAGCLIGNDGKRLGAFDLVIDASGARSVLRAEADASAEPEPLAYGAFWASLPWPASGFDPAALLQRYDKASVMIGVLPIGRPEAGAEEMAAFFWSLKPNDADVLRAEGIDALKARIVSLWPDCAQLTSKIAGFDDFVLARYGHHTLMRPAGSRLAIIGDAAHSASPQLGQGANMALLDAAALAHTLATCGEVEDALDAYVRARRLHIRVFQSLSYFFTPFYQSDSTMLPFLRDRLVSMIARIPPGPQTLAAIVTGTLIDPFRKIGLKEVDWEKTRYCKQTPDIAPVLKARTSA